MQKNVVLIFSPPDKRKKLVSFFKDQNMQVYNIESKINSLDSNHSSNSGLRNTITKYPRNKLQEKWQEAISELIITISNNDHTLSILLGHLLYYKDFTKEFFSIFDTSFLIQKLKEKKINLSYTVLIIDDIYDIYASLEKSNELYDTTACLDFIVSNFKELMKKNKDDPRPNISWKIYCLTSILNWRSQEITLAQNIATQTKSKFILWGLKQNPLVLKNLIIDNSNIYYLSHPISEPRRDFKKKNIWPNIVEIINNFQSSLLKQNILIQMPTSIDEYRLEKDSNDNYSTFLSKRWPLSNEVNDLLKSKDMIDIDIDNHLIITPEKIEFQESNIKIGQKMEIGDIKQFQGYVNGIINTLEMSIREQLANRDHLLVLSTDGIIVLEPYSVQDKKIHRGIQKEIEYLAQINSSLSEKKRRVCALFLQTEVSKIINDNNFNNDYIYELGNIISKEHGIKLKNIQGCLDFKGKLISSVGSMGKQFIPSHQFSQINNMMTGYRTRALKASFISTTLGLEETDQDYIMMIFLKDFQELSNEVTIKKIKEFFIEGKNNPEWETQLEPLRLIKN
jgi:hypothetical protein